jgi:hypothetical protein
LELSLNSSWSFLEPSKMDIHLDYGQPHLSRLCLQGYALHLKKSWREVKLFLHYDTLWSLRGSTCYEGKWVGLGQNCSVGSSCKLSLDQGEIGGSLHESREKAVNTEMKHDS